MPIDSGVLPVRHVLRGELLSGDAVVHEGHGRPAFATPAVDLARLVWTRTETPPAFDLPHGEIVDFLVETGGRLSLETNIHLAEVIGYLHAVNPLATKALEQQVRGLPRYFDRKLLELEVEENLGPSPDDWRPIASPAGNQMHVRPVSARLLHVLAGNGPGLAATTIIRGALSRSVNLLKLPSNDPFTAPAILATMADIDAGHPVLRSFSAAYWRGGDNSIESLLFRPQYFDKIVAWGGEAAIKNVVRYLGPGLELVALDPKLSISMVGREAFSSQRALEDAAYAAALDVGTQEACQDSRYQFVEGTVEEVDRYCSELTDQLALACGDLGQVPTPPDVREAVEILAGLEPDYRVWGGYDGSGLVVRSDEPVDFYPLGRTVNVVPVPRLSDAVKYVNVATQTIGVYPAHRRLQLRDALVSAGAQRVAALGGVTRGSMMGRPHDGHYLLHRMVRWAVETD